MTKPLGFFCNYTPGDGGLLGEMEENWGGSTFEKLNQSERIWVLSTLTGVMCADATENYDPYQVGDDLVDIYERFHEINFSTQLGLAEALIAQLKYYYRRPQ